MNTDKCCSNLKVLQVIPTLSAGGAEGFVTNLGVSLVELGAEVRFFLLSGVRGPRGEVLLERLINAGIIVDGTKKENIYSLSIIPRLISIISMWRPDIVQANLYSSEVVSAVTNALTIGGRTKFVRRLPGTKTASLGHSIIKQKILSNFYSGTIACADAVAESYIDAIGDRGGRLFTVVNGAHLLDCLPSHDMRYEARHGLGIDRDAFVITHVGSMWGGIGDEGCFTLKNGPKAQDILLKAFALAFGGDLKCVLVLVGDGPLRHEATSLTEKLGIESQVLFLGQQPEPWKALNAADLFCFPSRYEGLPNALIEAASCGLPVVASDIPEIKHLSQGTSWKLIPVDDVSGFASAMSGVRDNRKDCLQLARNSAHIFRESFSMKSCAENYMKVYKSVIEGFSSKAG